MTGVSKRAPPRSRIGIGLLGMGVVGAGVAGVLVEKRDHLSGIVGCPITLKGILIRDMAKQRSFGVDARLLTTDFETIVSNPEVDIVVEVMGGQHPALEYILKSISVGKHVATANKEVMARRGYDLLTLARKKGVHVLFEATVAGGTPIIAPLMRDLVANDIITVHGIINGTTNYILTKMAGEGVDFDEALKEAQDLGYAEADPTNDVEGTDAAYKLAILSTLAFRARVKDSDVYREGISRLKARDFLYARDLGYVIKLLAMAKREDGALQVRVHPVLVPAGVLIAKVDGVLNAVEIETDLAGRVLFHGRGAGSLPTASALVADIVEISRRIAGDGMPLASIELDESVTIRSIDELETKYYLRIMVADRHGVLAQIAKILGEMRISIHSVIQKGSDDATQSAELVLTTHRAREASMQQAIRLIEDLDVVHEVGNMVRVEDWDE